MIAFLIGVISFVALLEFFVSYSRAVIAESRGYVLSAEAREVCGFGAAAPSGGHFQRLVRLIDLCPESEGGAYRVRVVGCYFQLLELARMIAKWVAPSLTSWIDSERGGCAYVAAVALDQRIACSRRLMAQQAGR
jgi:hypothetical protein